VWQVPSTRIRGPGYLLEPILEVKFWLRAGQDFI